MKKNLDINWWQWSFILLLALNMAFLVLIATRLIQVREPESQQIISNKEKNIRVGQLTTTRESLNKTVASYLNQQKDKKVSYQLYASRSSIIFEGKYQLLGYEVPLYVYFQPIAQANGDIQLLVTSISAGTLPLPEAEVLQYIKSSYKIPSFVTMTPKKASIMIHLNQLDNDVGFFLKAKKLDLVNDNISFEIFKK